MKRQIAYAAMVIAVILIAYNIVDRVEQATEARIAAAESFEKGCLPRAGETAIVVSNGRQVRCITYTTPSLSPGMAKHLVSSAVVETPY